MSAVIDPVGFTPHLTLIRRLDLLAPKSATPDLPGILTVLLLTAGMNCQSVSRARMPILLE